MCFPGQIAAGTWLITCCCFQQGKHSPAYKNCVILQGRLKTLADNDNQYNMIAYIHVYLQDWSIDS